MGDSGERDSTDSTAGEGRPPDPGVGGTTGPAPTATVPGTWPADRIWEAFAPPPPPPPPEPKPPPTPAEVKRSGAVVLTALVVGIMVDVFLRGGTVGVGAALTVTTLAVGLLVLAPDRTPERGVFATLAVLASCGLVVRTSPWIVILDWIAALAFLGLASSVSHDRRLIGSSLSRLVWRSAVPPTISAVSGAIELSESVGTLRRRPKQEGAEPSTVQQIAPAIVRGLLIAVPTVVLLGSLLASADGVFASFFDVPTPGVTNLWSHVLLVAFGAAVVAGFARWSHQPEPTAETWKRPIGPVEVLVVLGGLTVLYALFAVAQIVATTGGDDRVRGSTGLTYAEYARSGFFQLLWCAAITIAVLLGLRALARPGGPRQQVAVRVISATTCALTLVVVGTAITRLDLYRDAYGLTMLRLACTTFGWVLGVAFLLLGVRMLQSSERDWLPAAYLGVAVVTLGWWNVSNPEVHVVETNLDRAVATGKLDVDYLDTLSDDAMPAVLHGLDVLPATLADDVRTRLCSRPGAAIERVDEYGRSIRPARRTHVSADADGTVRTRPGLMAFNTSHHAAQRAVQQCADELER